MPRKKPTRGARVAAALLEHEGVDPKRAKQLIADGTERKNEAAAKRRDSIRGTRR